MSSIGVVHLIRYQNGIASFARFLDSYARYPGGIDHDLLILFKGFENEQSLAEYNDLLQNYRHERMFVPDVGFDIEPYFRAVHAWNHQYFCFLNSFSVLREGDWLAKMHQYVASKGVGLVGASGSWTSVVDAFRAECRVTSQMTMMERLRRSLRLRRYLPQFDTFPNPHIRTNGFLIERDILRRVRCRAIRRKMHGYLFESGKNSLTNQIIGMGLKPLVVGKDDIGYEVEQWADSNCFWQEDQRNLLIADNQTEKYQNGDVATRIWLSHQAWGDQSRTPAATRD